MGNCQEGMVFVKGGQYKGQTISDLCVDQHEFTNADTSRVTAQTAGQYQMMSVNPNGSTVEVVESGKDPKALWAKIAAGGPDLTKGVAGYFLRAVSALPSLTSPEDFDKPNQPQVNVNGHQAKQFCEAQGKRLLTPIEWKYVASQGGSKEYSTRSGKLDSGVHYDAKATRQVCEAVGHYIKFGGKEICDMRGNVWEWTLDSSGNYYISGGSWDYGYTWDLLSGYRGRGDPGDSDDDIGFRCGSSAQDSDQ